MKISSPAFEPHQRIPGKYTCDGEDVSPPLSFDDVPDTARSLAIVMNDPDAPGATWDHWLLWNIPPTTTAASEGEPPPGTPGNNSWGHRRYAGPCPPVDGEHRYVFTLYALDVEVRLPPGVGSRELAAAMAGHILTRAELVGMYGRSRGRHGSHG